MIDIFNREYLLEIDEEKTIENGKKVCALYQPLVEKRIKQLLATPINSASIVTFSGSTKGKNSIENKLIEHIAWNEDQVGNFIRNILELEKSDKILGGYLKWKCFYGMTDKDISSKMKVTDRTLRNYKSKAYYLLAVYANQVEFIYEYVYHFCLN